MYKLKKHLSKFDLSAFDKYGDESLKNTKIDEEEKITLWEDLSEDSKFFWECGGRGGEQGYLNHKKVMYKLTRTMEIDNKFDTRLNG